MTPIDNLHVGETYRIRLRSFVPQADSFIVGRLLAVTNRGRGKAFELVVAVSEIDSHVVRKPCECSWPVWLVRSISSLEERVT